MDLIANNLGVAQGSALSAYLIIIYADYVLRSTVLLKSTQS